MSSTKWKGMVKEIKGIAITIIQINNKSREIMKEITIFKNERFGEVRVAGTNDQPLFCLADICKALELTNPTVVANRLDEEERTKLDLGRAGNATFINESGLYTVILRSDKKEAKQFRKWVTSDVLPTIRKHGAYMTDEIIEKTLTGPDYLIQLATTLKEERQKRIDAEQKNAILMHVNKTYTSTEIAKECNLKSAMQLNKILSDMKIQYQSNGTWVLYSKFANMGYEEIKQEVLDNGKVIYHRRFTQYGRDFIVNLLKDRM